MYIFCSTVVGGEFLNNHPEVPIHPLLLELEALDTRTDAARLALMKETGSDDVMQSAKALGHEYQRGMQLVLHTKGYFMPFVMAGDDARKYLATAVQQLECLLLFLKEEFILVCDMTGVFILWSNSPQS